MKITASELRALFAYDPQTGIFTRKFATHGKGGSKPIGSVAGFDATDGRRYMDIQGKRYYAHRLAWLYMTGDWPVEVDHRNCDPLDNRWDNLRLATRSQNNANMPIKRHNTSGFKGVSWNRRRNLWRAQICVNKRRYDLGHYRTPQQASEAYNQAAQRHFGEFANI